jgi:hypothetical protein
MKIAGLAATFAVSFIGTVCGCSIVAAYWSWSATHWQAVEGIGAVAGAIATFVAVLVALSPIWTERAQQHAQARILGTQLQGHMRSLIQDLKQAVREARKEQVEPVLVKIRDTTQDHAKAVLALFPQSHLLAPAQFEQINVIAARLGQLSSFGAITHAWHADLVQQVIPLLEDAVTMLGSPR